MNMANGQRYTFTNVYTVLVHPQDPKRAQQSDSTANNTLKAEAPAHTKDVKSVENIFDIPVAEVASSGLATPSSSSSTASAPAAAHYHVVNHVDDMFGMSDAKVSESHSHHGHGSSSTDDFLFAPDSQTETLPQSDSVDTSPVAQEQPQQPQQQQQHQQMFMSAPSDDDVFFGTAAAGTTAPSPPQKRELSVDDLFGTSQPSTPNVSHSTAAQPSVTIDSSSDPFSHIQQVASPSHLSPVVPNPLQHHSGHSFAHPGGSGSSHSVHSNDPFDFDAAPPAQSQTPQQSQADPFMEMVHSSSSHSGLASGTSADPFEDILSGSNSVQNFGSAVSSPAQPQNAQGFDDPFATFGNNQQSPPPSNPFDDPFM
jgi:hypothetical protein